MVVIEGIEGAGKSTAIDTIKNYLSNKNIPFICVREPGGTEIGEQLRNILKYNETEFIQPVTELLLMYASRTQLFHNVIKKSLADGLWVISDRFELSSYAYQGIGRGIGIPALKNLSHLCLDNFKPDLTIYLDVTFEISQQRISGRGISKDRIEKEDSNFFNKIRQAYIEFANVDPQITIIDASNSIEDVELDVTSALAKLCS